MNNMDVTQIRVAAVAAKIRPRKGQSNDLTVDQIRAAATAAKIAARKAAR